MKVKISAKSARLPFILCGPYCISLGCKATCCDAPTHPMGCRITVHPTEKRKITKHGVKVQDGYIVPPKGTKGCPFKTDDHLCSLHETEDKPFGCIASPFMLNKNGTLVIRNRYKMLPCYGKKPQWGFAYDIFYSSLQKIFGNHGARRIKKHLDDGGDDMHMDVPDANYKMLVDREHTLHQE